MRGGPPPFLGTTAQEVLARHTLDPVPPLRASRPDLPAAVERAVGKALAKAPADRFATPGSFSEALATVPPPAPVSWSWARRPALYVAGAVAMLALGYFLLLHRPTSGGVTFSGPAAGP